MSNTEKKKAIICDIDGTLAHMVSRFVLDDRNRVVSMWREQGLKVLQVAEGDF